MQGLDGKNTVKSAYEAHNVIHMPSTRHFQSPRKTTTLKERNYYFSLTMSDLIT